MLGPIVLKVGRDICHDTRKIPIVFGGATYIGLGAMPIYGNFGFQMIS